MLLNKQWSRGLAGCLDNNHPSCFRNKIWLKQPAVVIVFFLVKHKHIKSFWSVRYDDKSAEGVLRKISLHKKAYEETVLFCYWMLLCFHVTPRTVPTILKSWGRLFADKADRLGLQNREMEECVASLTLLSYGSAIPEATSGFLK